jgi:DNA-directed RNA polymerase specialized sigma24 family protein
MNTELEQAMLRVRELVVQYRAQCLWFLKSEYFPVTAADAYQVLDYIQKYGDLDAFRPAGELKQWLARISNAVSAA